jgi:hypothetical protein
MDNQLVRFLVTLDTPNGQGQLEVPTTLGADAAGRRAFWQACNLGWGDVDTISIVLIERID